MPTVELIYDSDCPNVAEARAELLGGFERAGLPARWQEWERAAPDAPGHVRRYGSPTILVDGEDLAPMEPEGAACCRLYRDAAGPRRTPSAEQIARRLTRVALHRKEPEHQPDRIPDRIEEEG